MERWVVCVAYVAIGGSWIVGFSSGNALETSLAMWLLTWVARLVVLERPERAEWRIGTIGFLAVLARPDAAIVLGAMAIAGVIIERTAPWWRRVLWLVGPLSAVVLTSIVQVVVFHELLPNTYVAKDAPLLRSIRQGLRYLYEPFTPHAAAMLLFLLMVGFGVLGTIAIINRFSRCGYLLAAVIAQVLFIVKSGGDWMNGQRFLAPVIIPLIVVEVLGLTQLVAWIPSTVSTSARRWIGIAASVLLISTSVLPLAFDRAPVWRIHGLDDRSLIADGQAYWSALWASVPATLHCLHPGQLVATSEVGYLGYARQDLRILDTRGLTDEAIAKDAPASSKSTYGVTEREWYLPSSSVGRTLLAAHPAVILSITPVPTTSILGGAYTRQTVKVFGGAPVDYFVPAGTQLTCLAAPPEPEPIEHVRRVPRPRRQLSASRKEAVRSSSATSESDAAAPAHR